MKNLVAACFFSTVTLAAASQEAKVELSSERKENKSVEISFKKADPGYHTVVLNFSELTNSSGNKEIYSVNGTSGEVTTLRPTDPGQHIGYRYSYRYVRGKLKPRLDLDFCNLLPYAPGTNCEVAEAGYANQKYFGAEKPADWKSYFFYTDKEEMVTAIRKGIVVETVDNYETKENVAFTTNQNAIIIEHEDGSLVRYLGLKKGSQKVRVGDIVFPNTPLGLNTYRSQTRFGVSVFMYYLSSVDFESLRGQTLSSRKSLYSIITPQFAIDNKSCTVLENRKSYTAFSSKEIVTKEMSKKELKKYGGK